MGEGGEAHEEIWAEREKGREKEKEMEGGGWLILYVHKKTARRSSPAVIYPILESPTVPWLFIDYRLFYYVCVCVCVCVFSNVMWGCFVNWPALLYEPMNSS